MVNNIKTKIDPVLNLTLVSSTLLYSNSQVKIDVELNIQQVLDFKEVYWPPYVKPYLNASDEQTLNQNDLASYGYDEFGFVYLPLQFLDKGLLQEV